MFRNTPEKVFQWLIGMEIDGTSVEFVFEFWRISGKAIGDMYKKSVRKSDGID